MRTPTEVPGHRQAQLYRDRMRGLEEERVQKEAAIVAGDDVSDSELKDLDRRIAELEKRAKAAEAEEAKSG